MTAMQRATSFGLTDMRGMVYIPAPQGPAHPFDPALYQQCPGPLPYFLGQTQVYDCQGNPQPALLDAKYTIYNDSDFYNADFTPLWGVSGSQYRDDLGRYKAELNANYIRPYDWQPNPAIRNHQPFLNYAKTLGMHVSIPISTYTLKIMCGDASGDWKQNVDWVFGQIYKSSVVDKAAGMLEIFNEFDVNYCKNPNFVAQVAAEWKRMEDQNNIPDAQRLLISFPVTFGIANGLPGGNVLGVFNAIVAAPTLGIDFWKARIVYAVNTFNDGAFMRNWLTVTLPAWFTQHGIPTATPVVFTEYGRSSDQTTPPDETGQAAWVKTQFQTMWTNKPTNFLGAMAFVNEYRYWIAPPEPNFTITNFNQGPGNWGKPAAMSVHTQTYQNPNAPIGTLWSAQYQIDPQNPRQAYCEVAKVYFGTGTPPQCGSGGGSGVVVPK
ncbi:hypothetical protein [Methylocapsa acidiphila]|uniref:hypothetical protein n=1 Tax=Methylocapsa acidiphila TaxID=133552 RepID=UPI00040F97BE|nr:hypothetical protein [Methylocapsa acidiphila]